MKKTKGIFILALMLVIVIMGLLPAYADGYSTAKQGNYPASVGITGVDQEGNKIIFGSGTSGQTAPTAGLFPICGKGNDGKSYMVAVGADGKIQVTLSGADLGSTLGTNIPSTGILIAGKDTSGYLRAVYVKADGTVYISGTVTITAASFGTLQGSNVAPDQVAAIAGKTATGNYVMPLVGTDGKLYVTISPADWGSTLGTSVPSNGILFAGKDSSGYLRAIYVGADGTVMISGTVTATITAASFGTLQGSNVAPDQVSVMAGKTGSGNYEVPLLGSDRKMIVCPAEDSSGNPKAILSNSNGYPLFRFADALSATINITTTDKTAVVTPGAGNSLNIHGFSVSMQNAGLAKIYMGDTLIWQAYLSAGGFAEAPAGLPYSGTPDAPASVQFSTTPGAINIWYEEMSP